MSLKQRIIDDMKAAMRAKEAARLESIRFLRAAIQRREVDERTQLDDDGIAQVIQKQIKQSQDAIAQFSSGGRDDLAAKERSHVAVLQAYMPQQLAQREIDEIVDLALRQTAAESMRDMGKVMALLKPQLQGKADMGKVSQQIKARLRA